MRSKSMRPESHGVLDWRGRGVREEHTAQDLRLDARPSPAPDHVSQPPRAGERPARAHAHFEERRARAPARHRVASAAPLAMLGAEACALDGSTVVRSGGTS